MRQGFAVVRRVVATIAAALRHGNNYWHLSSKVPEFPAQNAKQASIPN
jgi:hypothetical protein